ncbi:MAG: anthranilate phosphoribosyltransferase [Phycisphaerales bacterium]
MKHALEQLLQRQDLARAQAADLLEAMASATHEPAMAGAILAALRLKGETPEEVAGFADAMRRLAVSPALTRSPEELVDIVGTGGDSSCSHNLSTGAALLAASCGLRVAKHGNRAISSACGSADVLRALGLPLPLTGPAVAECLERTGFTFLFAPDYHPAMAALAPVRRALGVRTIFNMLGPLTNPARPAFGVIGCYSEAAARTMAAALSGLEISRYFVIHGAAGWDEPTPVGPFLLLDARPGAVLEGTRDPASYSLPPCAPEDLRGGGPEFNAAAMRAALSGAPGPLADALVLGAALALEVAGRAAGPAQAAHLARSAIADGRAAATVEALSASGRQPAGTPGQGGPRA